MKFQKPSCPGRRCAPIAQPKERRHLHLEADVLCIEGGSEFLDALFTFTAFVLVFMVGLGFGLFVKGP
jgi:hypothetical protein